MHIRINKLDFSALKKPTNPVISAQKISAIQILHCMFALNQDVLTVGGIAPKILQTFWIKSIAKKLKILKRFVISVTKYLSQKTVSNIMRRQHVKYLQSACLARNITERQLDTNVDIISVKYVIHFISQIKGLVL